MSELSLFPEIEEEENKKLNIIGNGVDIAHGVDSSYSDFMSWLSRKHKDDLITLLESFFSNKRDIWGDLETALGEYDEDSIIDYCKPDEEIDYDHPTKSTAAIEDAPDWLFKPRLDELLDNFREWVDSIDIDCVERFMKFSPDSKYFSFNYTETLEKYYGISEDNILHIHGSRLKKNDYYIFGHDNFRDPHDVFSDNGEFIFIQETQSKIIQWMNELTKDIKTNIEANNDFFDELFDVKIVYAYGHSFNKIDWPYFDVIIEKTRRDIPWVIYYHSKDDLKNIRLFISKKGLSNTTLEYW